MKLLAAGAVAAVGVAGGVAAFGDDETRAEVVRVVDGDTLVASIGGDEVKVRLLNVDTPETKDPDEPVQCLGPEASEFLEKRLPPGTDIELRYDEERTDRYGRTLAGVFESDSLVNAEIAEAGLGVPVLFEPNDRFLGEVQQASSIAQRENRGLFAADVECTLPAQLEQIEGAVSDVPTQVEGDPAAALDSATAAAGEADAFVAALGTDGLSGLGNMVFAADTMSGYLGSLHERATELAERASDVRSDLKDQRATFTEKERARRDRERAAREDEAKERAADEKVKSTDRGGGDKGTGTRDSDQTRTGSDRSGAATGTSGTEGSTSSRPSSAEGSSTQKHSSESHESSPSKTTRSSGSDRPSESDSTSDSGRSSSSSSSNSKRAKSSTGKSDGASGPSHDRSSTRGTTKHGSSSSAGSGSGSGATSSGKGPGGKTSRGPSSGGTSKSGSSKGGSGTSSGSGCTPYGPEISYSDAGGYTGPRHGMPGGKAFRKCR